MSKVGRNGIVVHTIEGGKVVAHIIEEGREVDRQVIAYISPRRLVIDPLVAQALLKATLATMVVIALLLGRPEIALILVYLLRTIGV